MRFKTNEIQEEFHRACTMIQYVALWFEALSIAHFQIEPMVTRVFERIEGATETHPEGRAVDIRDSHGGTAEYTLEQVRFLVSEMNRKFNWEMMSCVIHHSFKGGPEHFHLQVPRNFKDAPIDDAGNFPTREVV